jgi:hypothetical protein
MARPEVTGKGPHRRAEKAQGPRTVRGQRRHQRREQLRKSVAPACYSIETFCLAHHISESFYYELKKSGRGPREMQVRATENGRARTLITFEAACDWRIQSEREAATAAAGEAAE